MARKKQIGRRVEGWKTKSWYTVHVPESFGSTEIGETISNDPDNVVGRVMNTTLGEVTRDYSKSHIKMRFRIMNVAGDSAHTEFIGHEVTRDHLRALVKRKTSRIDAIFLVTTKDNRKLRLTITCLTISRANLSQVHAIRKAITDLGTARAKETEMSGLIQEIVSGELAKEIFRSIKIIYPVRRVEIIKSKVETPALA